jgi:phosphate transport system substrate-binding protein
MQAGQRVGQYVLIDKLGHGGMGEVWKAEHTRMFRIDAIKILHASAAARPEAAERFLNEARLQSRLHHPNIVAIHDTFDDNGVTCMAMQFVDGASLEQLLRNIHPGVMELPRVLSISNDVLAALDYAHCFPAGAVVHRDVKPSNILIDPSGRALLTDFGIAFALNGNRLTREGTALGTVFYMSPEQIQDPRRVDARSDIYSFGCVLYELLAGRPPFGAESDTDYTIKAMHVKETPTPLRKWNASVPFDLEWIVYKALNKEPSLRFASCGEMASELRKALTAPLPPSIGNVAPQDGGAAANEGVADNGADNFSVIPPSAPGPGKPTFDGGSKKSRSRLWFGAVLAVVCLLVAGFFVARYLIKPREETILVMRGSTSVGDELAPKMAEAFLRDQLKAEKTGSYVAGKDDLGHIRVRVWGEVPGKSARQVIEVFAKGSSDAFACLAAETAQDRCDLGMSSRPFSDQDRRKYPSLVNLSSAANEHVIALDGIAVIVNPSNSVSKLSMQQLRAIYTGKITNWNQVGGANAPIDLYGRDKDSGTAAMFAEMVVGKEPQQVPANHQMKDSDAIVDVVMQSASAIGYVSSPLVKHAKSLAISDGSGAALRPTELAIVTEDYPIGRRLFLYQSNLEHDSITASFVAFAVNAPGQRVVSQAHYVGLTPKSFPAVDVPPDAPSDYKEIASKYNKLGLSFRFASGQASLGPKTPDQLDNLANDNVARLETYLTQHKEAAGDVVLIGFTDNVGAADYNKSLALSRAGSVADRLAADDFRIPAGHISSFGAQLPIASNETQTGKGRNRRVEVWVPKGLD